MCHEEDLKYLILSFWKEVIVKSVISPEGLFALMLLLFIGFLLFGFYLISISKSFLGTICFVMVIIIILIMSYFNREGGN